MSFERQMDSLQLVTARGFQPRLIQSLLLHPTSRTVRRSAGMQGTGDDGSRRARLVRRTTITQADDSATLPTGARPEREAYSAKVRVNATP